MHTVPFIEGSGGSVLKIDRPRECGKCELVKTGTGKD